MALRAAIVSAAGAGLLAIGCAAGLAFAAPAPQGTLTTHEYTLLSASELGLDQALRDKGPNWTAAATNACLTLTFGASTPLLASQKTDCLGTVDLEVAVASFPAAYARCARHGRKRKIICLAPRYKALARDAVNGYRGDVKARRAIVKRGLPGSCVAALDSTPKRLANDRKLVRSARRLSGDMHVLVNIVDGRTRSSKLNQRRINSDTRVFDRDIRLVLRFSPPADLSNCPHPPA